MIIRLHNLPNPLLPSSSTPSNSHKTPITQTTLKPFSSTTNTPSLSPSTNPPPDAGKLFRQKILYLQSLKINPTKALLKNPNLRSTPLSSIQSIQHCLSSIGIEPSAQSRILDMHPILLTSDPYTDIYPILDFLINIVQVPYHDIRQCIIRCPRLLVCNVEQQLKPTLSFLQSFGFVGSNRIDRNTTLLLVSSVERTLVPKIEYLEKVGFVYGEVREMVLRSPGLLTFSVENNYKPKMEFFLGEMKGELEEIRKFPQYFSFSLEGKIKPRFRLLAEHGLRMRLSEMLKVSDGEFNSRLIEMRLRSLDNRRL